MITMEFIEIFWLRWPNGVCGETDFPTESAFQSEMSPESFQEDTSLPNSSNDFLRPPSPSRKLLSLKGIVKLKDGQTTRKFPFTEQNESKIGTSATKKTANFASQEPSTESAITQKTMKSTTEETTTESTTEETTTETTTEATTEGTTTETTTESTTEETTTETTTELTTEGTTESTTEETTTERTTESTTEETTTEAIKSTVADKIVTKSSTKLPNATKSWEKYLSKSTPAMTASTHLQNEASSSKASMSSNFAVQTKGQSDLTVLKNAQVASVTKQPFGYTQSTLKISSEKSTLSTGSPTKKQKHSKEYSKTSVTESKLHVPSTNQPTTTPSRNNASVNISIDVDIDINLLSSLNTTSEDSEENSTPTETTQNREKRYEKKRVVAGVLLVVLVSVSAACAILLVLLPSNYDVRCRRHHQIPDQVALIPSRNRCRPRFYDSSLYMGH
ncbi:hypothetical protein AVEN_3521-1 [Araneus ventricosus]|uniref:Uncharacterized protein n=1 Tax=Araneus ventricosus TaxID=182803 RepID=A0A4Y2R134_ARAVE|nr:hypothetical protein AVEN_3521-1 [Araneus ventricosus]